MSLGRLLLIVLLLFLAWVFLAQSGLLASSPVRGATAAKASLSDNDRAAAGSYAYYANLARQDAQEVGIDPDIFLRQMVRESHLNPADRSPAGAVGIAQFMPATAAGLGVDPTDPVASLKAAAALMARHLKQYGGDYSKALAAYNCGSGCTDGAIARACSNGDCSQWQQFIPSETRAYIRAILQGGA